MKRVFIILCLILSLVACTEKMIYIELDDYPIDMTGYIGMTDDHHFSGLMPEEMLRCKEEGGSGIFYMGNTDVSIVKTPSVSSRKLLVILILISTISIPQMASQDSRISCSACLKEGS